MNECQQMRRIRDVDDWIKRNMTWQYKTSSVSAWTKSQANFCFISYEHDICQLQNDAWHQRYRFWNVKTLGIRMRIILKKKKKNRRNRLNLKVSVDELRFETLSYLLAIWVGVPEQIFYMFPMCEWKEECVHNSFSCDVESSGQIRSGGGQICGGISGWVRDTQTRFNNRWSSSSKEVNIRL